jgi:hypothetical protein
MTQSPLIQALKGSIAYVFYQLNANLCSNGIFSHFQLFCPGFVRRCASCSLEVDAGGTAGNKTAGVKPAILFVQFDI